MNRMSVFGALAGIAGLSVAALLHKDFPRGIGCAHAPFNGSGVASLEAAKVREALDDYFFKAHDLVDQCFALLRKSTDLGMGPIALPDDDLLEKAANALGGGLIRISRGFQTNELCMLRKRATHLYNQYRPVFERGNALLKDRNMAGVSISTENLNARPVLVNSLANEDWYDDLDEACNRLYDFLTESADAAQELVRQLEHLDECCLPESLSLAQAQE